MLFSSQVVVVVCVYMWERDETEAETDRQVVYLSVCAMQRYPLQKAQKETSK